MNLPLARVVRDNILKAPKRVNMDSFATAPCKDVCRSVGCIAGHVTFACGITPYAMEHYIQESYDTVAAKLLVLSEKDAYDLFYFYGDFPNNPYNPYGSLTQALKKQRVGTKRYAQIVARAIKLCAELQGETL